MKAKLRVPPRPENRRLSLSEMPLEIPENYTDWMGSDFENLIKFLTHPNMDEAHTAVALAFGRLSGLTEGMTFQTHSGMSERDWDNLAGTIQLNASIMRHAFEIVFEAAKKALRSDR